MEIITRVPRMASICAKLLSSDVQIGLVPTMGSINPGHFGLIEAARGMTDLVVVSIFAGRLQFPSDEEYRQHPRDMTRDMDLLSGQNVDYVFAPPEAALFPRGHASYVQVEDFGDKLPGIPAPVCFRGMPTTLLKLIHTVRPAFLFLSQKDALQGAIVRKMLHDLNLSTEVVAVPVARRPSGLAYGASDRFLSEPEAAAAAVLYRSLAAAQAAIAAGERQAKRILQEVTRVVQEEPAVKLEYAVVVHPDSLEPMTRLKGRALIAVSARVGTATFNDALIDQIPTG